MDKNELLCKVGLLCIKLTSDYRRETLWRLSRIVDSRDNALKQKELESNFDIGSFIVDCDNRKYFKIVQILDEDEYKTHAFVGFADGVVYKPRNDHSANRKLGWDLDECIRVCDWQGFYLNKDPESKKVNDGNVRHRNV
tara:strand:- start:88 stop:504 length:417 start_codon:yes stop_codon:yes gene_type:complete